MKKKTTTLQYTWNTNKDFHTLIRYKEEEKEKEKKNNNCIYMYEHECLHIQTHKTFTC